MAGGVDTDIRADEAVVADGNIGFVEDGEVEIGKESLAHTDLFAIITAEGLVDDEVVVAHMTEQFF